MDIASAAGVAARLGREGCASAVATLRRLPLHGVSGIAVTQRWVKPAVGPASRIRDNRSVAFVCVWASGMNSAVAVALSPALPSIAAEFGQGENGAFTAQLVQTMPAVAMIVGAAATGYASDRVGRRIVMLVAAIAFAITGSVGFVMPTLAMLVVSRGLLGLAAGVMVTVSYAVVAEYFQGAARTRMLGFCGGTGALSTIMLLGVAGPMVDSYGWRSVFLLFWPVLGIVPFILRGMHSGRPARAPDRPRSWRPILAAWPLWLLQIGYTIGMYVSVIQIPFIAAGKGIVSASTISVVVATTAASATVVAYLHGMIRRILDFRGMLVLISAAFGCGLMLCVSATGLPLFLAGAVVLGVGAGSVEPTVISRALSITPPDLHERAAGAAVAALFAGQFLNSVLMHPLVLYGGIDFAAAHLAYAYLAMGGLFLLSGSRLLPRANG